MPRWSFLPRSLLRSSGDLSGALCTAPPRSPWRSFLFFLAVFLLCYGSVLVATYGYTDDYPFLAQALRKELHMGMVVAGGRPTYALWLNSAFSALRNISDLRYLRLLCVIGIALGSWCLFRILVLQGWNVVVSRCLSVLVFTLPPFQVYAAWAIEAALPFSIMTAGGAWILAERALHSGGAVKKWRLTVCSILLLVFALTIYQPTAMFFWVFAAVALFHPTATGSETLRRFAWYGAIMGIALLCGFGVYKLGVAIYGTDVLGPTRAVLTSSLLRKLWWFVREPLVNSLNLIKIFPAPWLTWTVAVGIAGGLGLYFVGDVKERVGKFLMALLLLPLSYLPNLVIAESWASYRTQSALAALIALYAFFALRGYLKTLLPGRASRWFTIGLCCCAALSAVYAAYNVYRYFVALQVRELHYMRGQLAQADVRRTSSIYVIGLLSAEAQRTIAQTIRYDEFGLPSSAKSWAPQWAVYLLLREMQPDRKDMPIVLAPADGPMTPPPGALVIDMRKLLISH